MTRTDRIREHLDHLERIGGKIRVCPNKTGSGCACNGCAGSINQVPIRQHEIDRYFREKQSQIIEKQTTK